MYSSLKEVNGEKYILPKIDDDLTRTILTGGLIKEIKKERYNKTDKSLIVGSVERIETEKVKTLFRVIAKDFPSIYDEIRRSHYTRLNYDTGAFLTFAILKLAEKNKNDIHSN